MPKCPICDYSWKQSSKTCLRKVSQTTAKSKLVSFDKKAKTQNDTMLFTKIAIHIEKQENGFEFGTNYIKEKLNLKEVTNGDKILEVLAYLICLGKIKRTKFDAPIDLKPTDSRKGRGHKYKKINSEPCMFLGHQIIQGTKIFQCNYPNKRFLKEIIK